MLKLKQDTQETKTIEVTFKQIPINSWGQHNIEIYYDNIRVLILRSPHGEMVKCMMSPGEVEQLIKKRVHIDNKTREIVHI